MKTQNTLFVLLFIATASLFTGCSNEPIENEFTTSELKLDQTQNRIGSTISILVEFNADASKEYRIAVRNEFTEHLGLMLVVPCGRLGTQMDKETWTVSFLSEDEFNDVLVDLNYLGGDVIPPNCKSSGSW